MKTIRHTGSLFLLLASISFGGVAMAGSESSSTNVLLGTTWEVHQCLSFNSENRCPEDSKHPLNGDMIKVSRLFDNVGLVTYVSVNENKVYNFGAQIVGSGSKSIEIGAKKHQVKYLRAEFLDTGGGAEVEKRIDLYLIHDGVRDEASCGDILKWSSGDTLNPDATGKYGITECDPGAKKYHIYWSICTLDRSANTCDRKPLAVMHPDDSQGTGSGGDTGHGLGE